MRLRLPVLYEITSWIFADNFVDSIVDITVGIVDIPPPGRAVTAASSRTW